MLTITIASGSLALTPFYYSIYARCSYLYCCGDRVDVLLLALCYYADISSHPVLVACGRKDLYVK